MQHCSSFQNIKMEEIENSNDWNIHPFISSKPSAELCSSIKNTGLLHPPILLKLSTNKYQLVCGRARVSVFQQTFPAQPLITALVLDKKTSTRQILSYVLEDQLLTGSLSPMEKAYFFKLILKHMTIDAAADYASLILHEKVQAHTINKLELLLGLEPELQLDIHNGRLGEKTALELLQLDAADRLTLHSIFQELELGGGKQKRLLALSKDLAFGQKKSITELLAESDFEEILNHPEMNHPQKAANLFSTLQKKLFPQSNAAEEHFMKNVNKMELPASCTVSHSQAFEKDEISVILHFTTLTEVKKRLPEIKNLMKK